MIKKWDNLFKEVDFDKQHEELNLVWKECYRVLIEGGIACINIGDATRSIKGKGFQCFPNFAKLTMSMVDIGFTPLIPIYWKKISNKPNAFMGSGFLPPNAYVTQECEYIGIFRKGALRRFKPKDSNRIESSITKEQRDKWFSQIWEIKGERGAGKTSAYPEAIPDRLIKMFSVKGDTVLDPFNGSNTTGRVAESINRLFIGYEING